MVRKKTIKANGVVVSRQYDAEFNRDLRFQDSNDKTILMRCGLDEDAKIASIEVLHRMGFKNKLNEFETTTVKKAETDERQKNGTFV